MRIEQKQVEDRMAKIAAMGKRVGSALSDMLVELEADGTLSDRSAAEDADLLDIMLVSLSDAVHVTKVIGTKYQEQDVFLSAARCVFATDLADAERDLRFAEEGYMIHYWHDKLDELEASERATARAG